MKKYLQLIVVFLLVFACIVALSFLSTGEDNKSPVHQTQSWALTISWITDRVQSHVQEILDDKEVQKTLENIEKDSPGYYKDGATFMNRERLLPVQKDQNYYSEWTVKTPTASDRGARRIIEGKWGELYFTDDHYSSFTRIR